MRTLAVLLLAARVGAQIVLDNNNFHDHVDYCDSDEWLAFNCSVQDWDVSAVTDMSDADGDGTVMDVLFNQCPSSWNVASVTTMKGLFNSSSIPGDCDLSSWDVSHVTDMSSMFANTKHFNGNIDSWVVSAVMDMSEMFHRATQFNRPIHNWDVSAVTTMTKMFREAKHFNKNIDLWDVSAVTDMSSMFELASDFNYPLNSWNVHNVGDMSKMFRKSGLTKGVSCWDVSNVITMGGMFEKNRHFIDDLSNWTLGQYANISEFNCTGGSKPFTPACTTLEWVPIFGDSNAQCGCPQTSYSVSDCEANKHANVLCEALVPQCEPKAPASSSSGDKHWGNLLLYVAGGGVAIGLSVYGFEKFKKRNVRGSDEAAPVLGKRNFWSQEGP